MARGGAILAVLLLALAAPAGAAERPPWRVAEQVRGGLVDAQADLIIDGPRAARRSVARARRAYAGELPRGLRDAAPEADATVRRGLAAAERAAAFDDRLALAAARGTVQAALLRGAYAVTLDAAGRGDAARAQAWLKLREFRTATRYTRPAAHGTLALDTLRRGRIRPAAARETVRKDLLDAYQGRLRELLADVQRASQRRLLAPAAEAAARAEGYWRILRSRYVEDRGEAAARRADAAFAALRRAAAGAEAPTARGGRRAAAGSDRGATSGPAATIAAARAAAATLEGFTAAPFGPKESARRAQQLLRFLALVPVEYGRGVDGDRVTKDFEIQEAVAFGKAADAALADLRDQLAKRDRRAADGAASGLERLNALVDQATRRQEGVPEHGRIEDQTDRIDGLLRGAMPEAWKEPTDESDYDLIAITLDRMEAAIGAGQYRQAEQARLEAYAFFEFGPERRLKTFDQSLALTVEGLVWFGDGDTEGLARLIADRAPRREIRETRLALDRKLADSAATLGDSTSKTTIVTNAAIIVFREGLEAVLILAAITASFVGVKRRMRRPVLVGAGLGLVVSVITWVLAQTVLGELERYGEKLEAVVGLIAIGVLLLITNWFFHRVYWSEWIGRFHRQRRKLTSSEKAGFFSAQVLGLATLGLTSVYREGFETVLFLQSLQLSAGTATVLEGAGLGLGLTLTVAIVTFALQRKLPYKKMLIITGVLIGFVLIVMVGQTVRTMQGTGWVPITPIDAQFPYWWGLWFGVYPTWETIGSQIAAFVFVIGSYVLAQEVRVRRPRRRARKAAPGSPAAATAGGDGQAASDRSEVETAARPG